MGLCLARNASLFSEVLTLPNGGKVVTLLRCKIEVRSCWKWTVVRLLTISLLVAYLTKNVKHVAVVVKSDQWGYVVKTLHNVSSCGCTVGKLLEGCALLLIWVGSAWGVL